LESGHGLLLPLQGEAAYPGWPLQGICSVPAAGPVPAVYHREGLSGI